MAILNRFDTTYESEGETEREASSEASGQDYEYGYGMGDMNPWTSFDPDVGRDEEGIRAYDGEEGGGIMAPSPPVPGSRYYCPGRLGEDVVSAREARSGRGSGGRSPRSRAGMLGRGARRRGWTMGVGPGSRF